MTRITARVQGVFKPSDYPGTPDEATRQDLGELFQYLCPHAENPEIDAGHAGIAVAAQNPRLALFLAKLSKFLALEMPWTRRHSDLRELAIQAVNYHFRCDYSFQSRLRSAQSAGISLEHQALIPFWRTANVFTAEQRLVIEYALAVATGEVPDELFSRVVRQYGEREAVELTAVAAWWSFWAMIINATRPELDLRTHVIVRDESAPLAGR